MSIAKGAATAAMLCLAACGGSGVSGSVSGKGLSFEGAAGLVQTESGAAVLVLSPGAQDCSGFGKLRANTTYVALRALGDALGPPKAVAPGTYGIGAQLGASAAVDVVEMDGECRETDRALESGTVTIDQISGGAFAGSIDAHGPQGDHLSGSFHGVLCEVASPFVTCN
jgi:hypothetical protein